MQCFPALTRGSAWKLTWGFAFQIHLRHLVGGRARSYTGELPHERIFQVDFPERPGALRKFLAVFSPGFLITLFHYRTTGGCPCLQYMPAGVAADQTDL